MATLFHFPAFVSYSPHKNFSFTSPFKIYSCPTSQIPTINASLSKKPRFSILVFSWVINYICSCICLQFDIFGQCRVRKKVRSNEDLCNDIKEFMLEFRFPEEDHLPSFKEFLDNGRFWFLFKSSYLISFFATFFSLYIS